MPVEVGLIGATEPFWVILGSALDRVPRQIDGEVAILPIDARNPLRRDDHLLPWPPIACVGDHVADGPAVIQFFSSNLKSFASPMSPSFAPIANPLKSIIFRSMAQSPLFLRKLFKETKATTIAAIIERVTISYLGLSAHIVPAMALNCNGRVFSELEI